MKSLKLKRFRLLLVGTKTPENIGGSVRLLENFAVEEAALVQPNCEWKSGVAQWMATGSSHARLQTLPVFDDLKEAVRDCNFVVGFTARSGKFRQSSIRLEDIASSLPGKVALVFGREDLCLNQNEVGLCTHLCALDSNPEFPALNLSHSVAVVLSRLFMDEVQTKTKAVVLTQDESEALFERLREAMVAVGLNSSGNPERMLGRLKKIFSRAVLNRADAALLGGFFSSILRFAKSKKGSRDGIHSD